MKPQRSVHRHHKRMPAAERKEILLDAALEMFSRRGFKGATVKDIAAAANVTEALIFRHYRSKQALYTAVLKRRMQSNKAQAAFAEVEACMGRNDDEGVFRGVAKMILRSFREEPRFERVVLFAALEGNRLGLSYLRGEVLPSLTHLQGYIQRRQREGALLEYDPEVILIAVGSLAHSYGLMTEIVGSPLVANAADDEVIETYIQILMRGVRSSARKKKAMQN